ncbi:MAG: hypothetical protein V7L30_23505 [Nostoc sp.]|uniref:hypothetical protein n=1 Tax=Nostoc sp. TaxID=1180 RepID=UPI002FF7F44C
MKILLTPTLFWTAISANVLSLSVVAYASIGTNLASTNALTARNNNLEQVAKENLAKTCWKKNETKPFKLGDPIDLPGSANGRSPTSCIYNPPTEQFLYIAYRDHVLEVTQVYSRHEVKAKISQIKHNKD